MSPELIFEMQYANTLELIDMVMDDLTEEAEDIEHAINELLERRLKLESQ